MIDAEDTVLHRTPEQRRDWQNELNADPRLLKLLSEQIRGVYRHYKSGKRFVVHGVALNTDIRQQMVVFKFNDGDLDSAMYTTPLDMFTKQVEHEGQQVARYQRIDYYYQARADGACICESCGKVYWNHPLDGESLNGNRQPWLHILCNGDRVHS